MPFTKIALHRAGHLQDARPDGARFFPGTHSAGSAPGGGLGTKWASAAMLGNFPLVRMNQCRPMFEDVLEQGR